MSEQYLLSVQDLHTTFRTDSGEVQAVNGVSFNLNPGEILGIVGESGSGKSVTAYSVMQILADNGRIKSGHILYKGEDLTTWSEKQMSHFRGKCCSIVFQDPMTSLNPVFTIGSQLGEAIRLHTNRRGKQVRERAIEMLELVGINEPEKRIKQYPFELSGGMRQRVMIAMALACEPDILIADEPTTALDVTIQAQILELMQDLQKKLGMAVILVTHDLGVIADMCDNIIVMYGGRICERGTARRDLLQPEARVHKGSSAVDSERQQHEKEARSDCGHADQHAEPARRLRILHALRRGNENLPDRASGRADDQRKPQGGVLGQYP